MLCTLDSVFANLGFSIAGSNREVTLSKPISVAYQSLEKNRARSVWE